MQRNLSRARLLALFALLVVATFAFVGAGFYQLRQHHERREDNEVVRVALAQPPVDVEQEMYTYRQPCGCAVHRKVRATGRYDAAREVLIRNYSVEDRVGTLVLTPLVTTAGPTVFVARGWVPREVTEAKRIPPVPDGEVTVVGRVRYSEDAEGETPSRIDGRLTMTSLDTEVLAADLPGEAFVGYVELVEQRPGQGAGLMPVPAPEPDGGPFLAHARRWFAAAGLTSLAVAAAVWWLVSRMRPDGAENVGSEPEPART